MTTTTYLLTGDIGGTNSRMSLYDTASETPLVVKYFRNAEHLGKDRTKDPSAFSTFIVIPFLEHCWKTATLEDDCTIVACMATAGVVSNNQVRMTNLGNMLVDGTAIEENHKDKYLRKIQVCRIINDFVAQGYGCLTLKKEEVRPLDGPSDIPLDQLTGPKVCVGAGTGLGECYLTPYQGSYTCFPSEGGHVEYSPRNSLEVNLWTYLSKKFSTVGRISVERVVSGKGLANVYEFLAHTFAERIDKQVHDQFVVADDEQGKVVAVNAKPGTLCAQALSIMISAYGCEVGSAAIKWLPTGGLFVTGGLTPKNIQHIEGKASDFMKSYRNKGRVSPILDKIPLYAVMVEDLGVRGAHKAALMEYERLHGKPETSASVGKWLKENAWLALATTAAASFAVGAALSKAKR